MKFDLIKNDIPIYDFHSLLENEDIEYLKTLDSVIWVKNDVIVFSSAEAKRRFSSIRNSNTI